MEAQDQDILFQFEDARIGEIFDNFNLTIRRGEHIAITGPSGSGKTMLIDTLSGIKYISRGFFTHPALDELARQRNCTWQQTIARIASRHAFLTRANTKDFYYQQRFNSMDAENSETVAGYLSNQVPVHSSYWTMERVIERLRLTNLLDKHLIKLSNGETKRVLTAAALLKAPVVITMDHPLTGLDDASRSDFGSLIDEIGRSGITVIMVTDVEEVPSSVKHILRLGGGDKASVPVPNSFAEEGTITVALSAASPAGGAKSELKIDGSLLRSLLTKSVSYYDVIVELRDIRIKYGEKIVLDGVDWKIEQGTCWALTGPNGSGKSTLLSLINGDNPQAYANNITLFDKKRGSGESIWEIKQQTGFVSPELFQYFPADQSALQVVESGYYDTMGLYRLSHPARAEKALDWMKLLGIAEAAYFPFRRQSSGVQRLCLLARAMVKNPPLLILDEPLQGLDQYQCRHFRKIIDKVCELTKVTLIYVSHYRSEIPECVTSELRLDNGEIVFCGRFYRNQHKKNRPPFG